MLGTDETLEMVLSNQLKPIISQNKYQKSAKEIQPNVHVTTGGLHYTVLYQKTNDVLKTKQNF